MLSMFTWARLGRILEFNEGDANFLSAESTIQATVLSIGANTPPSVAADSLPYIVGGSPTGAWAGHANQLARFVKTGVNPDDNSWVFYSVAYVLNLADGRLWIFSGGSWQPAAREILTAARTYYVRSDGSDSNNGLSNTAGGAFLTVQRAIDVVASLDISIYSVGISVGAGTFASFVCKDPVGAGSVTISGAGATTIFSRSETTGSAVSAQGACTRYTISSAKIQAPNGTACNGVLATAGQLIRVSNVTMGACSAFHFNAAEGQININGTVTIDGDAQIHWVASYRGQIVAAANVTLSGTRAFSQGFALASEQALIRTGAITFTGSATGKRYTVATLARINVNGAGASYLPGNVAGTTDAATFGVYS